jgi:hypothetical protein
MQNGILKLDFSVLLLCVLCVSVVSPSYFEMRLSVRRNRGKETGASILGSEGMLRCDWECDSGCDCEGGVASCG